MRLFFVLLVLAAITRLMPAAEPDGKWNLAWFHDSLDSTLRLRSIQFTSERTGYALGEMIDRRKNKSQAVVNITRDGGSTWQFANIDGNPISLFCLPEDICWVATEKGILQSEEAGLRWRKISGQKGILRMHFASPTRGWAGGIQRKAWQTLDGGKTWTALQAAEKLSANPEFAYFSSISFSGPFGIIGGNSRPARFQDSIYPDWMVPEQAASRRELPGTLLMLETKDGGQSWNGSAASVFGVLNRLEIFSTAEAVALLEFRNTFQAPSELLRISFKDGKFYTIHQDKEFAVTSLLARPARGLMLAGVEISSLRALGIPGKVGFLSGQLNDGVVRPQWRPIPVDYRATANQVFLTATPSGRAWAATDTGMILRFDPAAEEDATPSPRPVPPPQVR